MSISPVAIAGSGTAIIRWIPTQLAASVAVDTGEKDEKGAPILAAKYTGLHALRHFFASWCINRRADGGLELPPKMVQERLGHSSITMTMDVYGHLYRRPFKLTLPRHCRA